MKQRTLCFLLRGTPPHEVLLGLKKSGFGAGKVVGFGGGVEAGETNAEAAAREVAEEAGVRVACADLRQMGLLTFLFSARPDWSQIVHVFLVARWAGEPVETEEMKPFWCRITALPFPQMWADASYWLPRLLAEKKIKACFVFDDDNETVGQVQVADWLDEAYRDPDVDNPLQDLRLQNDHCFD